MNKWTQDKQTGPCSPARTAPINVQITKSPSNILGGCDGKRTGG